MTLEMDQALSLYQLKKKQVLDDPYPFYRSLLAQDPVHYDLFTKTWVCTRYIDVQSILRDPRFTAVRLPSASQLLARGIEKMGPIYQTLAQQLIFLDPPDHSRVRKFMQRAFTPHIVRNLQGYIQTVVNGLLDKVARNAQMDVIRDLAYPLPATVIAAIMGLPEEDIDQLKKWADTHAFILSSFQSMPTGNVAEILSSLDEQIAYFRQKVASSQTPTSGPRNLIQTLVAAKRQNSSAPITSQAEVITEDEIVTNLILLNLAGHETTTHAIAVGLLLLLQHPEQLERLKADLSLLPGAIDEILRYHSPAQWTSRQAKEDVIVGGKHICAGQTVMLMLAAANRDAEQFPQPEKFDIQRTNNQHLAFGYGPHFCLGSFLAKSEIACALRTILQRFPHICLDQMAPLIWRMNNNLRCPISLSVLLR